MDPNKRALIERKIRDIADFPKPGIVFKDITPVLADPEALRATIELFTEAADSHAPVKILGIDARGFIFGAAVAVALGVGFVPVRKKGKLPYQTVSTSYTLEYGEAILEMHSDAVQPGERVVLVDDLLATGGTAAAAHRLVKQLGGELAGALFLMELDFLNGRKQLEPVPVTALLHSND